MMRAEVYGKFTERQKSLYWKEGVLRAFAFFFSSFSRGHCTTLDLTMNLSSHQIIVSWKERSRSDMPVNLILIFFSSSSKYLIWSVNLRSVLICYTTLVWPLVWSQRCSQNWTHPVGKIPLKQRRRISMCKGFYVSSYLPCLQIGFSRNFYAAARKSFSHALINHQSS